MHILLTNMMKKKFRKGNIFTDDMPTSCGSFFSNIGITVQCVKGIDIG